MNNKKQLSRRSFLRTVSGAALAFGAASAVAGTAHAQNRTGATDADTEHHADAVGFGRTGVTDADTGHHADRAGYGIHHSITDGDAGSNADPSGSGRGSPQGIHTGVTDSDSGHEYTDKSEHGRGHHN